MYSAFQYMGSDPPTFIQFGASSLGSMDASTASVTLDPIIGAGGFGGYDRVCSYAGDVTGDGYVDIILGYPYTNGFDGGFVLYY